MSAVGSDRFELVRGTPEYPAQLEMLPDPPKRLYGIGDPAVLVRGLAVVGSRRATPYGLTCARHFAGAVAAQGYPIISGGAVGCDQAAHRAALESGGRTVVVLAGGADVAYPRSSEALLAAIVRDGAVVSEHPWGTQPRRWAFRTRNRLIAGLSGAVLVVEACMPSGTFSTAEYATDANLPVFAVPGSVFAPECKGTNRLIRDGALLVSDIEDLRGALDLAFPNGVPDMLNSGVPDDEIVRSLHANPQRPDELAHALGAGIADVLRLLSRHEASGALVRYPDGRYGPGQRRHGRME